MHVHLKSHAPELLTYSRIHVHTTSDTTYWLSYEVNGTCISDYTSRYLANNFLLNINRYDSYNNIINSENKLSQNSDIKLKVNWTCSCTCNSEHHVYPYHRKKMW